MKLHPRHRALASLLVLTALCVLFISGCKSAPADPQPAPAAPKAEHPEHPSSEHPTSSEHPK